MLQAIVTIPGPDLTHIPVSKATLLLSLRLHEMLDGASNHPPRPHDGILFEQMLMKEEGTWRRLPPWAAPFSTPCCILSPGPSVSVSFSDGRLP